MLDKLEAIKARFEDLGVALSNPEIVRDNRKFSAMSKEYRSVEKIVIAYNQYKDLLDTLEFDREALNGDDPELKELAKAEKGGASRLEPLKNLVLEANQAGKWVLENNWLEMKSFLQKVGSNRLVRSQTLTVSFNKPLIPLALHTVAAQHAASESERSSIWWSILTETRSVLEENPLD